MKIKQKLIRNMHNDAVSEIIGTVVLLALAVASFSVVFYTVSTTLTAEQSPQVNVIGFIEGESIILEHHGGESLGSNIRIDFIIGGSKQSFFLGDENENVTFYDENQNDIWDVGEKIIFSSVQSISNLMIDTSVIDKENNKAVYIATLQTGEDNITITVDLTTVVQNLPDEISSAPYQINASGSSQLDQVTLFYAYSATNWSSCVNQTLVFDDFENGFGNYSSGGSDCDLYTGGTYAYQGDNAIHIQDSGDAASFYLTNDVDVEDSDYISILVDFWFYPVSMQPNREFTVDYYDGSDWQTVKTYEYGTDFTNNNFYHKKIWINESEYLFPTDMNIRFKGNMENNNDDLYFDQIYINASCEQESSSEDPVWLEYDADMSSPWNWDFSFLNGSGYYQFYSIGEYNADREDPPAAADAETYFSGSAGSPVSQAISIWYFDENMGSIAYDFIDDNDGTVHNATWATGGNGSALFFNGENASVHVERDNNPELDPVDEITVMAWVKNTARDDNYMSNIVGRSGGSEGYSYRLYLNDGLTYDKLGMSIRTETEGVREIEWVWDEMNESWFHMAFTFSNNDDGTVVFYHNGNQIAQSFSIGQNLTYRTSYDHDDVYIGSGYEYTSSNFKGCIDDVRIYDYALSPEEIKQIVNETKPEETSPISSWNFDENTGIIAYDGSDGNDGVIFDASWTNGIDGSALLFDNDGQENQYVTISDNDNLDLSAEGTIEAWIKINSYQDYAGIVHKGNQNDFSDEAYTLQFWNTGRTILFGGNDDSGNSITIESSEELNLDQWYHLVGTWNESSIKLYINGNLEVEETFTIDAIKDTDGSLQIGTQLTDNYPGYGYFGFDGIIDQVALYNTALELNEIQEKYNRSKPNDSTFNRIGHWQFDEGTGSTAFDSINGNDGLINGATWTTGKVESGLNFDGTQQEYVTIPYDSSIALDHNYSVAFWIYPTDETVQWSTFLTRSNQFTCSYIGNDEIRVHVNGYANIDSQTSALRNRWTHVVFTFENSEAGDDKIIIYMNGESDGQVGPTWGTPNTPTNSLILGGDASSSYFTGSLDEIIIYDKALSADEVSTLYSQYD